MLATQTYFALDLELNNASDNSTPNPPIIQVGIAIGSWDDFADNTIIKHKWYIDPYEPIFPFITELTGITDEDIRTKAVTHAECAYEIMALVEQYHPYRNFITWGGGDSAELKQEFTNHGVEFKFGGHRWIDVKTWHTLFNLSEGKNTTGGLRSVMQAYKLKFIGQPHRADDDALNTLRLFFTMLDQQDRTNQLITLAKTL